MTFSDYIVLIFIACFLLWLTHTLHIWGVADVKVGIDKQRQYKKLMLRRKYTMAFLGYASKCSVALGVSMSEYKKMQLRYRIERTDLRVKAIDRTFNPLELDGIFKILGVLGVFAGLILIVITLNPIPCFLFLSIFAEKIWMSSADTKIAAADLELEQAFPHFFVVLNSRLKRGKDVRIDSTLVDYMESLVAIYGSAVKSKPIYKFVLDIHNNIMVYASDDIAIKKLRNKYHSAMIINFINIASQSLSGVDNRAKLEAFESELNAQELEAMKKHAESVYERGSNIIKLVYIVLGEFIVLSWVSKININMISTMFNFQLGSMHF